MRKILLAGLALCWAGVAHADNFDNDKTLNASLDGPSVVSGGDADGTGSFVAHLVEGEDQLCYTLTTANLSAANVGHLHEGDVGMPGRPLLQLRVGVNRCVSIGHDMFEDIKANPSGYYVDVVHDESGADAIRGQVEAPAG
jgi:hypothetical protein